MKKRIFISKNSDDCEPLVHFCNQNKLDLTAQSLIEFEAIPFKIESNFDIVFFSSIRSAQFYFEKAAKKSSIIYACIGETTNSKLKKLGIECEFVGKEAGNPLKTAAEFKNWVKNRIVFFPQSNLSLGTFSAILPENQVLKQVVYKTKLKEIEISKCQIYIFTSPSNLDAFLIINEIIEDSKVIVWGNSTFEKAKSKGLKVDFVLTKSSLDELIQILSQIC
jgi:uroporphyrinogen-III synthase